MKTPIDNLFEWPFAAPARMFNTSQPRERRKKTLFRLPARELSEFAPVLLIVLGLLSVGRASAQTFTTLYSFTATQTNPLGSDTNSDGALPFAGLILSGNTLYGTAYQGGDSGYGTVFAVNIDGTGFTNLHSFTATQSNSLAFDTSFYTNSDGANPWAGLILSGNTLYGTATAGGSAGAGTVFAVNTDGTGFTNLHSFTAGAHTNYTSGFYTNSDGADPHAGLILSGNTLYGTAIYGGSGGLGTVFAINTDGSGFTNLHSFTARLAPYYTNSDGSNPQAGLVLSGNTLYGTAFGGGSGSGGTVFAVNTDGTGFMPLHSFAATSVNSSGVPTNSDGRLLYAGLVLSGNTLYGTAHNGGTSGNGTVFAVNTDGTGFTNLHSFTATSCSTCPNSDGAGVWSGLILSGNTVYGTASQGGSLGSGTAFAISADGTGFTTLHSFNRGSDGGYPRAGLILSGDTLYGTAWAYGSSGNGTVFSITLPGPVQTFTVTSTADSGPGTLRDALSSAANGDTIDATAVSGTILLTSGELLVPNNVTILGPGPANLAVNGNAASRVFHISGAVVTIVGLTITNGWVSGSGGGIFTGPGTLTVSNCSISGNSASAHGGGIYNEGAFGSATLTLSACTLSGNSASTTNIATASGGGIYNDGAFGSASLTLKACTLSGNSANPTNVASGPGGGIYNDGAFGSATLTLNACTLSVNSARTSGGGIYNEGYSGTGTVQIANSTLSGNSATTGGGIYNDGGGGGSASVELGSAILKAGAAGGNIANLSGIVTSDGYNLASDGGGGFLTGAADQINTDPMLGPLQDNAGPTFTHALLPGSPAIDQGKNFNGSATDQRGFPRTLDRPCIANAPGGDGTDIGAFEVQQPCPVPLPLVNVGVVSNHFVFDLAGSSNQVVVVEASTNLVTWTPLATNTLGASPLHFFDPGSTNYRQRFYRAKLLP